MKPKYLFFFFGIVLIYLIVMVGQNSKNNGAVVKQSDHKKQTSSRPANNANQKPDSNNPEGQKLSSNNPAEVLAFRFLNIPSVEITSEVVAGLAFIGMMDKKLLLPYLLKFDKDPKCLLLVCLWSPDFVQRNTALAKLKEIDPLNLGLTAALEAKITLDSGKNPDKIKSYVKQLSKSPINWYIDEFEISKKSALRKLQIFSAAERLEFNSSFTTYDFVHALYKPTLAAWEKVPENERISEATDYLAIVNRIAGDARFKATSNFLLASGMEMNLLKTLPPDTEYGDSGTTVADRMVAISSEGKDFRDLLD